MKKVKENAERENRIDYEIVVDAYDEYERVAGWYCYLEDKISFPFKAKVIKNLRISPLKEGDEVLVLELSDQDDCNNGIFVQIEWETREFGVPLEQLYPIDTSGKSDADTKEAVEDWHYWVDMGYCF